MRSLMKKDLSFNNINPPYYCYWVAVVIFAFKKKDKFHPINYILSCSFIN